jgi:hypothetical protein
VRCHLFARVRSKPHEFQFSDVSAGRYFLLVSAPDIVSPLKEASNGSLSLKIGLGQIEPATVLRKSEGRVYYQIDNFDNLREPRRTRASESEAKRLRNLGPRYTYSVEWYDRVEPGARIYVRYQCFSDGDLIIVGENTKPY